MAEANRPSLIARICTALAYRDAFDPRLRELPPKGALEAERRKGRR